MRILVLGAGGNAAMNFIKCLRLAYDDSFVVGVDTSARYFDALLLDEAVHLDTVSTQAKLDRINNLIDDHNIDLVHAQADPEVKFLCNHGKALNANTGPLSYDKWKIFADKYQCQKKWAVDLGTTFKCAKLVNALKDPALFDNLKQSSGTVWIRAIHGAGSKGALPVRSIEHARMWAEYWQETRGIPIKDFMLAEFLPGAEYAVQTVWKRGALISSQARQRVEYVFQNIMPSGQSSTPSVAKVVSDPKIYDVAERAIHSIDPAPDGVYCVDLKTDVEGNIIPLEVNYGRFFTTSDFVASNGVNGPATYVKSIMGEPYEISVRRI